MIIIKMQGGLGNQMFEYAIGRAFQERYQEPLCLDYNIPYAQNNTSMQLKVLKKYNIKYDKEIYKKNQFLSLTKIKGILFDAILLYLKIIRKIAGDNSRYKLEVKFQKVFNTFGFYVCLDRYTGFYKTAAKNKILFGYWQCEKYFSEISNQLKQELTLDDSNLSKQGFRWRESMLNHNSVCVHIRRGDYINSPLHFICGENYYINAIKLIEHQLQNPVFYMFSDDIDWVKNNIKSNCTIKYIDNIDYDYEELSLMSYCKHFIISNSSFSWWGQYLSSNQDKTVIAPSRWYNGKECDIYMDSWYLLNT